MNQRGIDNSLANVRHDLNGVRVVSAALRLKLIAQKYDANQPRVAAGQNQSQYQSSQYQSVFGAGWPKPPQ